MRRALLLVALACAAPARGDEPKAPAGPHARRVLFVHVSEYLYLTPLTHAAPGGADRTREAADRLARGLRVPSARDNDQLFVLSDTASDDAPVPTKATLLKAVTDFCATTREHDRVVLYVGAHAVEKGGQAFVVPIDGDPTAAGSLLPVGDIYAALGKLKAAQKVVIWDVCRANPERARPRRDTGPMTAELLKALAAAPAGVQVLVSCSPGETAHEYLAPRGPAGLYAGSAYLDALRQAATDHLVRNPKERPDAPIPVEAFHAEATKFLAEVARQKPVLAGAAPKEGAAYDAKAAPAARFEFAALPKADPDVKAVLDELALPPLFDDGPPALARLAFDAPALKARAADVSVADVLKNPQKYPVRAATLRALGAVREQWPLNRKDARSVALVGAPVTERSKRAIADVQLPLAQAQARLELELDALDGLVEKAATEVPRWKAHFAYARAELQLRLAVLNEFNFALARVRTEALPDLPPGATGWRLTASEKMSARKEARELYQLAAEGFDELAAAHAGTPWEVLARRSRAAPPGLRWDPDPPAKPEK